MEPRDSVVVITGASSGIGRATAHALARQGAGLVLAARNRDALEEACEECRRAGAPQVLAVPTDVAHEDEVRALTRRALDDFGRIDVWINDAAVTLFGRVEEVPSEAFEKVIRTNLLGYVYGARAVLPLFRAQGHGVLINVASTVATLGQPFTSAYVTSKWAIRGFSECLRMELADAPDIHVCTVMPASIDTPLFQHGANYSGHAPQPMAPVYPPEKVADTIASLLSHPQREVFVGGIGPFATVAHAVAPALTERRKARKVETQHFQHQPAPRSEGNLFRPLGDATSGGWLPEHANGGGNGATVGRMALGAALIALPLGLIAWRAYGSRRAA